jgi:hypothetical protein
MSKFYEKDGRIFMVVYPVNQLMHSKLISDVVNNGRTFVVDMNRGTLTIDNENFLDELVVKRTKTKKKYVWWRGRGKGSRNLSDDFQVAQVQIADEWTLGHQNGRLYVNGQCKVNNDGSSDWPQKHWLSMIREIKKVYED